MDAGPLEEKNTRITSLSDKLIKVSNFKDKLYKVCDFSLYSVKKSRNTQFFTKTTHLTHGNHPAFFSAALVRGPQIASIARSFFHWKCTNAHSVRMPKSPSTVSR